MTANMTAMEVWGRQDPKIEFRIRTQALGQLRAMRTTTMNRIGERGAVSYAPTCYSSTATMSNAAAPRRQCLNISTADHRCREGARMVIFFASLDLIIAIDCILYAL